MRTLVYTDYAYHRGGDGVYSERAFSLFLARVAAELDGETVILGRLDPDPEGGHYPIGDTVEFRALPYYPSLASFSAVIALPRSLGVAWRAVGEADRLWLLGPHPLILALVAFAKLRGKQVVLGVRQDFPALIRRRRPRRRLLHLAADLLERAFRSLARKRPVVVVGPELAGNYAHAARLLEITVSLVSAEQIVAGEQALARSYDHTKTALSVGRLEPEKNPQLLISVLERLVAAGEDWRLEICGEGPLERQVAEAAESAGVRDRVELAGYVRIDDGLLERYRQAHVLLHSSLTEGFPQILLEAFAAGLPVVASDVGGIRAAVGAFVEVVPPGDALAAAGAVQRVVADRDLRQRMIEGGMAYVRGHTLETEVARVARFISAEE